MRCWILAVATLVTTSARADPRNEVDVGATLGGISSTNDSQSGAPYALFGAGIEKRLDDTLWLRGGLALGPAFAIDEGHGGAGEIRVGIEERMSSLLITPYMGLDVALLYATYSNGEQATEWGTVGLLAIPRIGVELGGGTVRLRLGIGVPVGAGAVHHRYGDPTYAMQSVDEATSLALLHGFDFSLGLLAQY